MSGEQITKIINQAESFKDEPPRPLRRSISAGEPYPVDTLGTLLGGAAKAIFSTMVRR